MAIYRSSTKPKTYKKRYGNRTRKPYVSKKVKKYVSRAITQKINRAIESKHVSIIAAEDSFSTLTGQYAVANFYQIAQGTAATQRVGLSIKPTGISIRGNLHYNATTAAKTCYVRLILIETGVNETFTALTTELYEDTAANGSWGSAATGQMNNIWFPLNRKAYKFHMDKVYKLNAISADGSFSKMVKHWIPLKGKIHYDANSSGAGGQSRNFCLVICLAEAGQDVGVGETVEFSYNIRTYFKDA